MAGTLFAHLFAGRGAPCCAKTATEGARIRRGSPGRIIAPDAPGDCFPHVELTELHVRTATPSRPRRSVGKFPRITARARTMLGCSLAGGAVSVALTAALERGARPSQWGGSVIAVTLFNAALLGLAVAIMRSARR